jgi:hypothetical protein
MLERAGRVGNDTPRNRTVQPQRLTLISVQAGARLRAGGECLDLTPPKAPLRRGSHTGQHSLVAQIDDVLSRHAQDLRGCAGSNQLILIHE